MTTAAGVDIQHLVAKLDAISNALATVDGNMEHLVNGLAEIEEIARHCNQGMEPAALLLIADIAKGLR